MYEDEPLKDYYTLMDIAYIYTWRRVRDRLHYYYDFVTFCYQNDMSVQFFGQT